MLRGFPCACVLVCVCVQVHVCVKILVVLTFSGGSILLEVLSSEWAQDLCVSVDM
jgi:hypothetical protein